MARTSKYKVDIENQWNTALYIRLSREDGDKEESNSVSTQRDILSAFISEKPEYKLYDIYIDDGFSGTDFERPDFQRMEADIKQGKINCIIVKDLSRLGRNYTYVGVYQDLFSRYNVRFIAINDHVDTADKQNDNSDLIVPIKNIFNEQYAHDISIKVRSALDIKRRNGEFIGAQACYGYMKDPTDKHHLVIDEEVAPNVALIFNLFLSGMAKGSIAKELNSRGIVCPSEYKRNKGVRYTTSAHFSKKMYWNETSIRLVLKNQIYTGDMVQHKQSMKSFKIHQNIQLDKSQWVTVPNTHQPIIDREIWDKTQKILGTDTRKNLQTGNLYLFAGLIYCGDCGRAMSIRTNSIKNKVQYIYYICGTYRTYGKEKCSSHAVRYDILINIVLDEIKNQISKHLELDSLYNDAEIRKKVRNKLSTNNKKITEITSKISKLEILRQGLYEDFKSNIIDKEQYFNYKNKYTDNIDSMKLQLVEIQKQNDEIDVNKQIEQSKNKILKYKDITELSREAVVDLVSSIYVYMDKNIKINFTFDAL